MISSATRKWRRYSEYRPSGVEWLGEIPEYWESNPLFSFMREQKEKNEGNKIQDVLSLSYGKIVPRDTSSNFGLMPESFETYQIVYPGNIILRLTDLQNDKTSLRAGLVNQKGIITSAYVCLQTKQAIRSSYGYYLLHSYDISKIFYNLGGGVRQAMKFEDLKRLPVLNPPQDEQRAIAAFLDQETVRIDALISKKERQIELLQEKRTALISHAVTKGLNPNVKMKPSGIEWLGEIPENWEVKRLRFCISINPTKVGTHALDGSALVSFVPMEAVGEYGGLRLDQTKPIEEVATGYTYFRDGDVIIAKITPCFENGKGAIAEGLENGIGFGTTELHVLRPRAKVDRLYLFYLTLSHTFRFIGTAHMYGAGGQKRVPDDFIRDFRHPIPPIEIQRSIAYFLDRETGRIDALIGKIQGSITKLREFRTALISAAVTGKIDVRNNQVEGTCNVTA